MARLIDVTAERDRLGAILQAIRDALDGDALSDAQLAHPIVREIAERLRPR